VGIKMSELIENLGHTNIGSATMIENLLSLANVFRDDGKYTIASGLYRRAISFVDGINPSEEKQSLLIKILDEQSSLARKMSCGHSAWIGGMGPLMFL
jgi:hypothetical protein